MREIVSPFGGFPSPFGQRQRNPFAPYIANGFTPELVADFSTEFYASDSTETDFATLFAATTEATSNGTMVDSDGLLKWRPHNLALNSASPATQSITVISGADYTVECTGVSIALSGAGTGTVTEGNPVEITASTTTLTLTVTGSTGTMWCYRSDLGGMVNNPDRGDSYVPTTTSARYLPRRGHHVWNGSAWVNEGVLVESESRTNLVEYSDFSAVGSTSGLSVAGNEAVSPSGISDASRITIDSSSGQHYVSSAVDFASGEQYTGFVYLKYVDWQYAFIKFNGLSFPGDPFVTVDLLNKTISEQSVDLDAATIEDVGNGWMRVSITDTADAVNNGFFIAFSDSATGGWNPSFTGDGTSSILIYGAQLEAASTPSSYIPTNGATATRGAETLTVAAADLPWPTPNVIGPELVTNGTFDTDISGWTDSSIGTGTATWSSGTAQVTKVDGSNTGILRTTISTVSGNFYKLTGDLSGDDSKIAVGTAALNDNIDSQVVSDGGSAELYFTAQGTTTHLYFLINAASGTSAWDNISVREIDPLSVSIQMDGKVSYADGDSASEIEFINWEADSNNLIDLYLSTASSATGRLVYRQKAVATSDVVETDGATYSPGILVPYNIASRHGSTFINGAVDGVEIGEDITPTALPDLSATDLNLAYDYMGTLKTFRMWNVDVTDEGLEQATT